ncbi:hypothetical protein IO45_11400 [Gallibacterium anatis]|uniref:hypothetical protein n=1 Tax=Gallibacterium anatis TaxID=750 RepID=UPI0005318704|nr:hypothetical protein [Gallibacterium anatis]KGQ39911.1 hypothetical protein JP30_09380 [Gallibacterium anatis IPDH697-78]KGQ56906.1 hypothetical protein IO45_11400 [Gallibacterium anatis]
MSFICIKDDSKKAVWLRKEDIVSMAWDKGREELIILREGLDENNEYDEWVFEHFTQQEYAKLIQQL